MNSRFDNHHKMGCIKNNGATHIHAHLSAQDDATRRAEEADIVARWKPNCNG